MSLSRFDRVISAPDELESLIGVPSELVLKKQLCKLDKHMQQFIAQSPFLLVGTVDADGNCDVSPRGESPAVATVLDDGVLVIPERPGNRRADSLRNIVRTGRAGLLFLVPGIGETLRVNGRACVMRDQDVLGSLSRNGRPPVVGIGIEIEECYFQCAKALIRSGLWEARESPCFNFAEVLVDQTCIDGQTVESLKQQIEASYRERLY